MDTTYTAADCAKELKEDYLKPGLGEFASLLLLYMIDDEISAPVIILT
jgi:hypothetical protein